MATVSLTPGDHTINWSLNGYEPLQAIITVHTTGAVACISSINGICNTSTPPGIYAYGSEVVGYLSESIVDTEYGIWLESIGGSSEIQDNLPLFVSLINEYYGLNPTPVLSFTLDLSNFIDIINYYYGIG